MNQPWECYSSAQRFRSFVLSVCFCLYRPLRVPFEAESLWLQGCPPGAVAAREYFWTSSEYGDHMVHCCISQGCGMWRTEQDHLRVGKLGWYVIMKSTSLIKFPHLQSLPTPFFKCGFHSSTSLSIFWPENPADSLRLEEMWPVVPFSYNWLLL